MEVCCCCDDEVAMGGLWVGWEEEEREKVRTMRRAPKT
jgi:hypothetical protein